ncbi:MAG: DUF1499 domain-containing protein [Stellaceae bacterium]
MRVRPIVTAALGAGLALVIMAAAVRLFMSRPAEDRLRPMERIDIAALSAPLPRPSFLACPEGYCAASPDLRTPVFAIPWRRLRGDWLRSISDTPRVVLVDETADGRRLFYIQHSRVLRFPDVIAVAFVALGPEQSGIAVFSRSRYGRSDFGVNRGRVERWLDRLENTAGSTATRPRRRAAIGDGAG